MKASMSCSVLLVCAAAVSAQEKAAPEKPAPEKAAPADVQQRLQRLLAPARKIAPLPSAPVELAEPRSLRTLAVPLPPLRLTPPRPEPEAGKPIHPRLTREPLPLLDYRLDPAVPQTPVLPTVPPVALPEVVDGSRPIPVPTLARHQPDRAPLADATAQSSREAALARSIPNREESTPFTPMNLPNPFQNQQTVRLRQIPPENPTPQVGPPAIQVR